MTGLFSRLTRGRRYQRVLDNVDHRIAVSGIRGKSSTTRRLHDIFVDRGYDTFAKVTGDYPLSIHNGTVTPIERSKRRVTLYENFKLVDEYVPKLLESGPDDVLVFENQAITEYTMTVVNRRYVRPNVVLLCNVRQDHNDTLGTDRRHIARSFARSIPEGCHVISGEQHPVLHDYLEAELARRDATLEQVDIPLRHEGMMGAETIHALDHVLDFVGEAPVPAATLDALVEGMQPSWTHLPEGRVFNAAKVNEVESTELFRRLLAPDEPILPFVFSRADRRSRSASFVDYLNRLAAQGAVDHVHLGGAYTRVMARQLDVPTTRHDTDRESAASVLDTLLDAGQPVVFMANTVAPFMRDLDAEVKRRAAEFASATAAERATDDTERPLLVENWPGSPSGSV